MTAGPQVQNQAAPSQPSHISSFLLASFFLFGPAIILLIFGIRAAHSATQPKAILEHYERAIRQAEQPIVAPVSHSLLSINSDPVTVVTWTQRRWLSSYQGQKAPEDRDFWVTVSPNLKKFCQGYVRLHGADPVQLAGRLEQRLGLPPASGNDTFVELNVSPKDNPPLFRPCKDPSVSTTSCEAEAGMKPNELNADLTDPQKSAELKVRYWLLNNYYRSYAGKDQYPWTYLGYTFDWALREGSDDFVRFGESEFILPAGAPMKFLSATDTITYCSPQ